MSLLSSSEVVQFAVNIEENGYHYYRSIAEKLEKGNPPYGGLPKGIRRRDAAWSPAADSGRQS